MTHQCFSLCIDHSFHHPTGWFYNPSNFRLCIEFTRPKLKTPEDLIRFGMHGRPPKIFHGGQLPHFSYLLQVADNAMQMDVHKTLYPFYTTKIMPHATSAVTKIARCWQQCFFFTHASFPHSVKQGGLLLSAVTVSSHYFRCLLRSTTICGKTHATVTWIESLKICWHVIVMQKRPIDGTIRSQVSLSASAGKGTDMSELQTYRCMTPGQWNWLLWSVSVIPGNEPSLQELDELIPLNHFDTTKLLTWGSLQIFYS